MTEAKEKAVRPQLTAEEARFKLAEYERQDWILNAPHGTEIEDVIQPEYWAHIAAKMRPYDHVEVRAEDGSYIAQLIVLGCDRNWAKVQVLNKFDLVNVKLAFSNEAKVIPEWSGPHTKWRAKRVSDGAIVSNAMVFQSKDEVIAWIRAFEEKVNG